MCGIRIVRDIPGLSVLSAYRSRCVHFWLVFSLSVPIVRVFELVRGLLSPLIASLSPFLLSGAAHDISLRTI